jgi:hypothetical protein
VTGVSSDRNATARDGFSRRGDPCGRPADGQAQGLPLQRTDEAFHCYSLSWCAFPIELRLLTFLMRQRKRADWPIIVYQYWVRLEYDAWASLPEGVKREAEAMRALWNQLVEAFLHRHAGSQEVSALSSLPTESQQQTQADPPVPPAASQHSQQMLATIPDKQSVSSHSLVVPADLAPQQPQSSFLIETRQIIANAPVTWANKQFVTTQFQTAVSRFFKGKSRPPRRKTGELQRVHFHHRFTEGGLPIAQLFGRSRRLHLASPQSDVMTSACFQQQPHKRIQTTGIFQVGDETLSFDTIIHRPLPSTAYLKAATLVGQQIEKSGYRLQLSGDGHHTPARWRWSLHLTLEIPHFMENLDGKPEQEAVLDVDCQFTHSEQFRIAKLTDTNGREESIVLPLAIFQEWQRKRALQSKVDKLLVDTKMRLKNLENVEPQPLSTASLFAHLESSRAPGLWRVLEVLERSGHSGLSLSVLQQWADYSTKLLHEARGLERRYLGHRDWFYRNTALHLCQRYQRLSIILPEEEKGDSSFSTSPELGTYQHLAAPARFVAFLQHAAKKTNTEIHIDKSHASTFTFTQRSDFL